MGTQRALAIGTFDGVHLGHAQLASAALDSVGSDGHVSILTFDPHPVSILKPGTSPNRLSTLEQRTRWFKSLGVDAVLGIEPTALLLERTAEQFLQQIIDEHQPDVIVEGDDFRFGKGRAGDVHLLRRLESTFGYRTVVVDPVQCVLQDHAVVRAGSRMIRWLIARGRVGDAQRILGRPYETECVVERGDQRGRTLNMPTANLRIADYQMPGDGVYAGRGLILRNDGSVEAAYPAAISVGSKPSFEGRTTTCEGHLCNYHGALDSYGWTLRLEWHAYLRDQLHFQRVDDLVNQMNRDVQQVIDLCERPSMQGSIV